MIGIQLYLPVLRHLLPIFQQCRRINQKCADTG
jgi:hypothetical protein